MSLAPAPIAAVDSAALACCQVTLVGCGGSHHLATSLARSGVRRFQLIDADIVTNENLSHSDFLPEDVGQPKVVALGKTLQLLGADVEPRQALFEELPESVFAKTTLLIAATDSFAGQAAVNRHAVRHRTPALFCGVAQQGYGGEIVFWYPGLPCFRCLLSKRYQLRVDHSALPDRIPSTGTSPFDLACLDGIAGHIALGLLVRGTKTRFGLLLATLGDRNFLRLKIDPHYRQSGRDCVRAELGIAADNTSFTGWCVSAQADPGRGNPPCPDCVAAGPDPTMNHWSFPHLAGSLTPSAFQIST